jgi:hypothetical protein
MKRTVVVQRPEPACSIPQKLTGQPQNKSPIEFAISWHALGKSLLYDVSAK